MKNLRVGLFSLIALFTFSLNAQKITGIGTYYADKFHGRSTTTGVKYHRDSLTCAHRTLPFGTYVLVRNPKTDKSVIVKVNDRGPFIKGRIIDVSAKAARILGFIGAGIAKLEILPLGKERPSGLFADYFNKVDTIKTKKPLPFLTAKIPYLSYEQKADTPLKIHNHIQKQFSQNSYSFFK